MSQCVPDWDHHESPDLSSKLSTSTNPHPHCTPHSFSMLDEDYGVSELTWKNGQVCMNGLGNPPIAPAGRKQVIDILDNEKLLGGAGGGTLESIINQAAGQLQPINHTKTNLQVSPWFNHDDHHNVSNTTPTTTFDALVPSSTRTYSNDILDNPVPKLLAGVGGRHNNKQHVMREDAVISRKRKSVAISHHQDGSSSRNHSVAGSENSSLRKESNWQVDMTPAFTSTSLGSVPENTVSSWESFKEGGGTTMEGENKTKEKEREKSSGSTRRSRAAAIHNQSERKRRDKINQRMKTLQKLVPNSNKTDKASMLDEVIEYIKQLQAQVQSVSMAAAIPHMNMMMPQSMTTMQQQFQLLMMAQMTQMGMSMGMNMGSGMGPGMGSGMGPGMGSGMGPGMGSGMGPGMMDLSSMSMGRNIAGMPSFLPSTAVMPPDPLSALLATQSQQISRDQYSRIAALYQQMNQNQ